jgi:hypothetical protein
MASLSNDPRASLRELMFWLDRADTRQVVPTLEQFTRESGMPELLKEEDVLQAFLFARPSKTAEPIGVEKEWSGKPFYQLVAQARRVKFRRDKKPQRNIDQRLSLNPLRSE